MPNNFFARNEFGNLHFAPVNVWDRVRELGAEFVGVTFDFSRPPSPDVVDGVKDFLDFGLPKRQWCNFVDSYAIPSSKLFSLSGAPRTRAMAAKRLPGVFWL
jgi:hypothetical protein